MSCHQPAYRSSADRDSTNTAEETRGGTIVNTGSSFAVRV